MVLTPQCGWLALMLALVLLRRIPQQSYANFGSFTMACRCAVGVLAVVKEVGAQRSCKLSMRHCTNRTTSQWSLLAQRAPTR